MAPPFFSLPVARFITDATTTIAPGVHFLSSLHTCQIPQHFRGPPSVMCTARNVDSVTQSLWMLFSYFHKHFLEVVTPLMQL